jgi:hypothetical protein
MERPKTLLEENRKMQTDGMEKEGIKLPSSSQVRLEDNLIALAHLFFAIAK